MNSSRRGTKSAPDLTRVDVYNGSSKQLQVFSAEPKSVANSSKSSVRKRGAQRDVATAHLTSDVEIFNGTTKERRVFAGPAGNSNAAMQADPSGQPVVIGITSSGSVDGAKAVPRVVTGIISSGSGGEANEVRPVAVGVSPNPPKRPLYVPVPPQ